MPEMLSVAQAAEYIMQSLSPLFRIKKLLDEALGYCLAEDIAAERDYPPFDRVTMDGMAINYNALKNGRRSFVLEKYAAAGSPQIGLGNIENAVEVATGAPLPEGCDSVVPYESFVLDGKIATMNTDAVSCGDAIHPRGTDARRGEILLKAGRDIGVPDIAVLAGNGVSQVPVYRKPSIAILATGNELADIDAVIEPHQIRRSNDRTLKAALASNGFSEVECGWVPDDRDAMAERLSGWIREKDVVLITGGVSRGARDYVPDVLKALDVKKIFHRVAQRPGKPLWYGRAGTVHVFGLPGNPNSSLVCLIRYVLPLLGALSGSRLLPPRLKELGAPAKGHDALTVFMPVMLDVLEKAWPKVTHTSGDFTGLSASDGFVALPPAVEEYAAGFRAEYYPWRGR